MIQNDSIKKLVDKFRENKLSHVFLVETNAKENALLDILNLIKIMDCPNNYQENCNKCNICHLVDTNNLPTLEVIYPDGQAIKKQQMENLKMTFSHIPYISKYNVYIINDAEKFNASSANTMLKFIEEPLKNTVGFLITNNKENVISTIKSRCEIIKANYILNDFHWSEELVNFAISYLYDIEILKNKSIVVNKKIIEKKYEKSEIMEMFQIILQFYLHLLNGVLDYESLTKLQKLQPKEILKRIQLVNELLDKMNYNININLLLDDFVLRLED